MLGKRDLYAAPDDSAETWCLLAAEYSNAGLCIGWHVGFGNVKQLVRTQSLSISTVNCEGDLLTELMEEHLDPCRRGGVRTTLITPSRRSLPRLRTRLLANEVDTTFRGLFHFSVESIVDEYFHRVETSNESVSNIDQMIQTDPESVNDGTPVESLWEQVKQVGPLVPRQAMIGTRL